MMSDIFRTEIVLTYRPCLKYKAIIDEKCLKYKAILDKKCLKNKVIFDCHGNPSARGAYMLCKFVCVGFHSFPGEGAAS